MSDGNDFSGVDDVFASIRSDEQTPSDGLAHIEDDVALEKLAQKPNGTERKQPSSELPNERPRARVGRFPGSRNKNSEVQDKISGRIPVSLKDKYVDWALTDRCSINELLENALTEYYQRHRAAEGPKDTD